MAMEGRPMVLVVSGRKRPHELLLLLYGALIGVLTLARPNAGVMSQVLPRWIVFVWAVVMVLAGIAGLVAPWLSPIQRSLTVEFGALLLGGGAVLLYAFVVLTSVPGWTGVISGGMLCAWTAANAWRATQIATELWATTRGGP